jgi:hypothetical protein
VSTELDAEGAVAWPPPPAPPAPPRRRGRRKWYVVGSVAALVAGLTITSAITGGGDTAGPATAAPTTVAPAAPTTAAPVPTTVAPVTVPSIAPAGPAAVAPVTPPPTAPPPTTSPLAALKVWAASHQTAVTDVAVTMQSAVDAGKQGQFDQAAVRFGHAAEMFEDLAAGVPAEEGVGKSIRQAFTVCAGATRTASHAMTTLDVDDIKAGSAEAQQCTTGLKAATALLKAAR